MSHSTVALVHPEDGVFLGVWLGLAFFSKVDDVGQYRASVFADENQALHFFRDMPELLRECKLVPLSTADEHFATYLELLCANIDPTALNPLLRNQLTAAHSYHG